MPQSQAIKSYLSENKHGYKGKANDLNQQTNWMLNKIKGG